MNFTEAVKRYRYGKVQPPVYCSLLSYFRIDEEMLPAIRHAKVFVIPGGYFFCRTELSFPLDREEKYFSAEIKGACGET